ncbi:Uncharacterised protein [Mycobacteroides abscessus]|nr:Uncharacterised protein [Mycobacteroides abscessus]
MRTRPSGRESVAVMWPRRAERSPMTSPCASGGTVTVTAETGSSTTVPAVASASRTPTPPAVRNAMSDESTECALPSRTSTRRSTTG